MYTPTRRSEMYWRFVLTAEVNHGRLVASRSSLEILLLGKSEETGHQVGRKLFDPRVVLLCRLVEAFSLNGNSVLRALELALQLQEVLVGFQIRVSLDDYQESLKSAPETGLSLLEFLKLRRFIQDFRRGLNGTDLGSGGGDGLQDFALVRRVTLDGGDQVRNQIRPPLINILDLRPLGVHPLFEGHDVVVGAA